MRAQEAPGPHPTDTACPAGQVPDAGFTDVGGVGDSLADGVNCLVGWAVGRGTSATTFTPSANLNREQAASFVLRLLDDVRSWLAPANPPNAFPDDDGSAHEAAVNALAAEGIIGGSADGMLHGTQEITRAQAAALIERMLKLLLAEDEQRCRPADKAEDDPPYADIVGDHHEASIVCLDELGILTGFPDHTFRPNAPLTRGQVAFVFTRTLDELAVRGLLVAPPFLPGACAAVDAVPDGGSDGRDLYVAFRPSTIPLADVSGFTVTFDGAEVAGEVTADGLVARVPVHDEIADLLAAMRRLEDLQVTVETRFISVHDDFFDRLGDVTAGVQYAGGDCQVFGVPDGLAGPTCARAVVEQRAQGSFTNRLSVVTGYALPADAADLGPAHQILRFGGGANGGEPVESPLAPVTNAVFGIPGFGHYPVDFLHLQIETTFGGADVTLDLDFTEAMRQYIEAVDAGEFGGSAGDAECPAVM